MQQVHSGDGVYESTAVIFRLLHRYAETELISIQDTFSGLLEEPVQNENLYATRPQPEDMFHVSVIRRPFAETKRFINCRNQAVRLNLQHNM